MTNKEAINILENNIVDGHVEGTPTFMDAFWMAVDALKQEPCDDCISREEVLAILGRESRLWGNNYEDWTVAKQEIRDLPSVTPKPKTGHWETSVDRWGEVVTTVNGYRCSECGEFDGYNDNFCPHCGVRMK